ncbi:SANT/Myb_domain [Hexamita inflata]|uniref:SANT/Myb domain n=1 Tax=Hexamita inflata TaxID=28002 RepID=A0AA86NCM7_9EUKA|nr:SANT/Myb domain [Hexamita inflata]CAI9917239.1 SANT/Myb domain [Hexamita inflata]
MSESEMPTKQWYEYEKSQLIDIAESYGKNRIKWKDVCISFPGTTPHQCKDMYHTILRRNNCPSTKFEDSAFSIPELEKLAIAYMKMREFGPLTTQDRELIYYTCFPDKSYNTIVRSGTEHMIRWKRYQYQIQTMIDGKYQNVNAPIALKLYEATKNVVLNETDIGKLYTKLFGDDERLKKWKENTRTWYETVKLKELD